MQSSEDKLLSLPFILVMALLIIIVGFNFYTSQNPAITSQSDVNDAIDTYLEENSGTFSFSGSKEETADFFEKNADMIIEKMAANVTDELINTKIAAYIEQNPHVIVQSLNNWQRDQYEAQRKKALDTIKEKTSELHNNPNSPYLGNPDGDMVVVEFFDYNCGFCKRVLPTIEKLVEEDPNVKLVFKEFPILNENSRLMSRFALAVNQIDPSKYFAFHSALMKARGPQSESQLLLIAENQGLDPEKLKQEANGIEVNRQIIANNELGKGVGVSGTPAFIIANRLVPGAIEYEQLKNLIAEERAKAVSQSND